MENQFNTLEFYKKRVGKILYFITLAGVIAGILSCCATLLTGGYSQIPRIMYVIYMIVAIVEFIIFSALYKNYFSTEEMLVKNFNLLKYFSGAMMIINYTFTINLMPSQTMWGCFVFFLLLIGIFQDFKFTIICSICFGVIVAIFFATHSVESLQMVAAKDESLARGQVLMVSIAGIIANGYFSGHVLANVGQDLMNKNTEKLTQVIDKVTHSMAGLKEATEGLAGIAEEENASMEEIASVSAQIVTDNQNVMKESQNSQAKLGILKDKVGNISVKTEETRAISDELVQISITNEAALNNVLEISSTIEKSTNNTLTVAEQLQSKVDQIDSLLKLIENIADETNLLALNASIEAARAGEEGKGFAVVAEQVKKLSENTASSLQSVNSVIQEFKQDTRTVEKLMADNVLQVEKQNNVTNETVAIIRSMLEKLKESASKIEDVGRLAQEENKHASEAVEYNKKVLGNMQEQVDKVTNIAQLVDENRKAIEQIVLQVEDLNNVVVDIDSILE